MPVETDAHAYLRIIGSGSVDLISKQMRLEPDAGWREGDPRSRGRGNYTFSNWELLSGEKKGLSLDAHLRSLWKRIEPYKEGLIHLGPEFTRRLVCVAWFPNKDTEFKISAGHFGTVGYYRLDLDFDFYFLDDFGHEDAGKGYASW
jgi:hypothetical protein